MAKVFDKYSIDFDDFEKLIKDLLPLCNRDTSPLTGKEYVGFANKKTGFWLAKIEAE